MIRLLFLVLIISAGHAAPFTGDLGSGLLYYRAHELPGDLPAPAAQAGQSCVLDLRFTRADAAAATALSGWIKFHAAPRSPVFILANAETSAAVLAVLSRRDASPGIILLGAAAAGFAPDIAVAVEAAVERTAYDAAESGIALDRLVYAPVEKVRNDEAKLARERKSETSSDNPPRPSPAVRENAEPAAAPAAQPSPPPLTDPVLQRAVHLHRALLALKRI